MLTATIRVLAMTLLTATAFQTAPAPRPSNTPAARQILAEPIYVAGYSVRTTNAAEKDGAGAIPKLWMDFYQQNRIDQIPNRIGQDLVVVYSDYASDEKGEYDYLLGTPVSSVEGLPKDFTYRKIPAGSYALVTSETGAFQQVIPAAWQKAWSMTPTELGGKRTYVVDYETFDMTSPGNGQVTIHLGITPDSSK